MCLNRRRSDEFAVSDSSTQFSNKKSEGNTTILLRTVACVVAHPGSEFLLGGSSQTPFPVPSPLQKYILTFLRFTDENFHTCQIVSDSSTRVYADRTCLTRETKRFFARVVGKKLSDGPFSPSPAKGLAARLLPGDTPYGQP